MIDIIYILLDNSEIVRPYLWGFTDLLIIFVWLMFVRWRGFNYKISLKLCLYLLLLTMITLPIPLTIISSVFSHASFLFLGFGIMHYIFEILKKEEVVVN